MGSFLALADDSDTLLDEAALLVEVATTLAAFLPLTVASTSNNNLNHSEISCVALKM
jgi:hypothetical protein